MASATTTAIDKPRQELAPEQRAFQEVRNLLRSAEAQLGAALPKHIPASYMIRVVLTSVQRTPELLECAPITLLGAVFQAAQLGLVPDGVLGQAYLVPYRNTKKNRKEVQFIPGYRGLISLVRRSGDLSTIDADVVREKDTFRYVRGTAPVLEHIPSDDPQPGKIIKVWAAARLKDGGFQIVVMNRREVEAIKARSAAVKSNRTSPWDTDEGWMFKKTCLKQLCKLLPASTESARAMALDDRAEGGLPQDLALLADENETPTPDSEDGGADGGGEGVTVDAVDAELALVPADHRDAIAVAFDALQMNKATRLVQLRTFKGRTADLVAMLREMVAAAAPTAVQGVVVAEVGAAETQQRETRSREMPSVASGLVGGTAAPASAAKPAGRFSF